MRFFLFIFLLLYSLTVGAQKTHVVQKGEVLSKLAQKYFPPPIYPTNGSLQYLLKLNPSIVNPNLITPGQIIILKNSEASNEKKQREIRKKKVQAKVQFVSSISLSYLSIQSNLLLNSSSGYAYSNLSPTLNVGFNFRWDERTTSFIKLQVQYASFYTSNNKSLTNSTQPASAFQIGWRKRLNDSKVIISYQFLNTYFLRSANTQQLQIDHSLTSLISFAYEWTLYRESDLGFSFTPSGGLLVPLNNRELNYEKGFSWGGKLTQDFIYSDKRLNLELDYEQKTFQTSQVKQISSEVSLGLRYYF